MATNSSILVWEIPWTEELGRLQSMRLQKSQTQLSDWTTTTTTQLMDLIKWPLVSWPLSSSLLITKGWVWSHINFHCWNGGLAHLTPQLTLDSWMMFSLSTLSPGEEGFMWTRSPIMEQPPQWQQKQQKTKRKLTYWESWNQFDFDSESYSVSLEKKIKFSVKVWCQLTVLEL